jgi:hypothetical protein
MSTTIPTPQNLADSLRLAASMKRVIHHARADLNGASVDIAEHVAHAYNYAGFSDSEANARGSMVLRDLQKIADALDTVSVLIGSPQSRIRAALDAIDEADAKRKAARAKLGA